MGGKHDEVRTAFALPEVVGQVDADSIIAHLQAKCDPHGDDTSTIAWLKVIKSQAPAASKAIRTQSLLSDGMNVYLEATMHS